jgi:hypothetical protein
MGKDVAMEPSDLHERLIRTLLRPDAYPWRPRAVELIETHISWVFLAGDHVLKIKRPVHFGFVDHSTLERRRRSCEAEVHLNRRLTDGVYRRTAAIARVGDRLVVDADGPVYEWATLMRRLPAERMLDALLAAGAAPPDLADRLAAVLIPFHRQTAAPCDEGPAALTTIVTDNLAKLRPFAGAILGPGQLGLIDASLRAFIAEHGAMLARRIDEGWIRDGHGDLRAEHVCLEPGGRAQIFDCVEFNPAIRCADIASDLAFLLMDLDRLGTGTVAAELVRRDRDAGVDLPAPLLRFYRAHWALVRAKVACLSAGDAGNPDTDKAREARDYLDLAAGAALTARPVLIAMTGLSGTGKSTVAQSLARITGAQLVASDVTRKRLAGVSGAAAAEWQKGIYAQEWTERTYQELIRAAERAIRSGTPVILDAAFLDRAWRERAATTAAGLGVPIVFVETVCDPAIAEARTAARAKRGDSPSDATAAIYRAQRSLQDRGPIPIPTGAIAVRVDTGRPDRHDLDLALSALRSAGVLIPRIPEE